jgi:hypothetical protein
VPKNNSYGKKMAKPNKSLKKHHSCNNNINQHDDNEDAMVPKGSHSSNLSSANIKRIMLAIITHCQNCNGVMTPVQGTLSAQ